MANFIGTEGNDTANAATGELVGFTGGNASQLQDGTGDFFAGGGGEDFIYAGNAADVIEGGENHDILNGGEGNDVIFANTAPNPEGSFIGDEIRGNVGDDRLYGSSGGDALAGDEGDDRLVGHDGDDLITGGLGKDNLSGDGGDDTIYSDDIGAFGDVDYNVLYGDDALIGAAGPDSLIGGAGADAVSGGDGNDELTFYFDDVVPSETIDGGAGIDTITAGFGSVDFTKAASISSIESVQPFDGTLTFTANQVKTGMAADLIVIGTDGEFDAPATADIFRVVMGDETSLNLAGFTFQGWDVVDHTVVVGDVDGEAIIGTSQTDQISGNGGRDTLTGGGGKDLLTGGGGTDVLRGGPGNDTYNVNAAGEAIEALIQGIDKVRSAVSYTLGANLERLQLLGAGDISGVGNSDGNLITGNNGENRLDGREGSDRLTGNAGADRFLFTTSIGPDNVDKITDFQINIDEIRLDDAVFSGLSLGDLAAAAFRVGAAAADASDRILYNDVTGALFFDVDGDPAGPGSGEAAVRFATVAPGLGLDNLDFVVA